MDYVRHVNGTDRPLLKLSESTTAARWLAQFKDADRSTAAEFLDRLVLLSEAQVSERIFSQLDAINSPHGRIALYAEREIAEKTAFPIEQYADRSGAVRSRAVPNVRFKAVSPRRGSTRVGSEGWMAFLVSQAVAANARYVGHPSPEQYTSRTSSQRIRKVVFVSDFVGSGDRLWNMLERFWRVPTFAAWWSRGYIRFHVVAAAGTAAGIAKVKTHRCRPEVHCSTIVPTLAATVPTESTRRWNALVKSYGTAHPEPLGYKASGALVAFEYGIPNNVPAILGKRFKGWRPLYTGRAPGDLNPLFGLKDTGWSLLRHLAEQRLAQLRRALDFKSRKRDRSEMLAFLLTVRGRWHADTAVEIAEKSGLRTDDILNLRDRAISAGWITGQGRLTDEGRKLIRAGASLAPEPLRNIAGRLHPYYPTSLRVS